MQRWSTRHQLRLVTELSITPMLNLVLVLLFVFMVTGPLLHEGGTLQLPAASPQTTATPPTDIATLTVDQGQAFTLDGRAVAHDHLKGELTQLVKDRPNAGVRLQLQRELPVQVLLEVMDTLRQAGVQKTAVATN